MSSATHHTGRYYEWILNSLATGVFTVDKRFRITFFNTQAEMVTGFARQEALGKRCWEILQSEACQKGCSLKRAMEEDSRLYTTRLHIQSRHGTSIPVAVTAAVLQDDRGSAVGGVESFQDDRERVALAKEVTGAFGLQDFVTVHAPLLKQLQRLPVLADSDKPLLIHGETGVGKDFLAKIVHNSSARRQEPFIKVNCAAIPETMLESELFGCKKGAFTDATQDRPGKFRLAQQGTLLLDELGELRPAMQAKLLQVIEENEYFPLGATRMETVRARVVATTNCDLRTMVASGAFRKDLYFRLKMCEVGLPALRQRPEDIPLLLDAFLERAARLYRRTRPRVSESAQRFLLEYSYPGNVREMKNILEYAVMVCGREITPEELPDYIREVAGHPAGDAATFAGGTKLGHLENAEKTALLRALHEHHWHIQETAKSLCMSRATLWRKMKRHDLSKKPPGLGA